MNAARKVSVANNTRSSADAHRITRMKRLNCARMKHPNAVVIGKTSEAKSAKCPARKEVRCGSGMRSKTRSASIELQSG